MKTDAANSSRVNDASVLVAATSARKRDGSAPRHCLLCRGTQHQVVFTEFDTDILRCVSCGHTFSSHVVDPQFDGFWDDDVMVADPYWSVARKPMYEDFRKRFVDGRSGSLLDMGCGLGYFVKSIADVPGWRAYGCEISPAAVRYAREKLGLTDVQCGRLDEVNLAEGSFDIITMWDVLDHLMQPDAVLQKCHSLLKEGGLCFIRTPNIRVQLARARANKLIRGMREGVTFLQATQHPHHYSRKSVRALLERNGFSEIDFMHFRPVRSKGTPSLLSRTAKAAGFQVVRALAVASGGHLNFDNLYVIARK